MKQLLWPILLQVALFAVIFVEIFIPSGGLLFLVSLALLVASWVQIVALDNTTLLQIFLAIDLVGIPLLLWWGLRMLDRSPLAHGQSLEVTEGYQANPDLPSAWVGRTVRTLGPLRPMGQIEIDGVVVEAASNGEFIEAATQVRILAINAQIVIVQTENQ